MNRVTFSMPSRGIREEGTMLPPKKYTDVPSWLKSARKRLRRIPELGGRDGWRIDEEIVSPGTIMFKLTDNSGQVCSVVIERKGTMSKVG